MVYPSQLSISFLFFGGIHTSPSHPLFPWPFKSLPHFHTCSHHRLLNEGYNDQPCLVTHGGACLSSLQMGSFIATTRSPRVINQETCLSVVQVQFRVWMYEHNRYLPNYSYLVGMYSIVHTCSGTSQLQWLKFIYQSIRYQSVRHLPRFRYVEIVAI